MGSLLICVDVDYGWEDNATPDGLTVELKLDRTSHEFYPALRELVRLYDAVDQRRPDEFVIGTADYVSVAFPAGKDDLVNLNLEPVQVFVSHRKLSESLQSLLREIFERKSEMSTDVQRKEGLTNMQTYLDKHEGETNVKQLYQQLTSSKKS